MLGVAVVISRLIEIFLGAARTKFAAQPLPAPRRRRPARPPRLIRIRPDDDAAEHVGTTSDGQQFFVTNPFVPATGKEVGCEFAALYVFDAIGGLVRAEIIRLGPRKTLSAGAIGSAVETLLASLGKVRRRTIRVAPFSVSRFGVEFGLIPVPPEDPLDPDDHWWVEAQPGNYMAFTPPWTGEYDT